MFQFTEAVISSAVKESLCSTKRGSLQALAVLWEQKLPCTTVTNFGSEGKPMLTECGGSLSSFALLRYIQYGHYCYKLAM